MDLERRVDFYDKSRNDNQDESTKETRSLENPLKKSNNVLSKALECFEQGENMSSVASEW